jgi:glycosyltransferase involved in cell wall biosynthesis
MLDNIKVMLVTTGHEATDHRIYDKEACGLASLGALVTIIGRHTNGQRSNIDHVHIIEIAAPKNRIERFFIQPWRCYRAASPITVDFIHIQDAELLQIVPWLRFRWSQVKVVYDVHEDYANLIKIRSYLPRIVRPFVGTFIDAVEKGLARLVHGVVGATQPLADRFPRNERIAAYNFPSQRFYRNAKENAKPESLRKFDLVHIGTLSAQRARFLADIVHILYRERPTLRILVTGLHRDIYDLLQAFALPSCSLEGQIPYGLVPMRLGDARVGLDVHPFRGAHLDVAVPVKLFEYMACGCAIVCSQMPVLNQLLAEHDVNETDLTCIDGGTPETYASAIIELLDRINKGEDVGGKLREVAYRYYVWENEAEKLANFYLNLLRC